MKLSTRLNRYFEKDLKNFVFDELSKEALIRMDVNHILGGVPVPLKEEDVRKMRDGEGVNAARIAVNMAYILGCNPYFKLVNPYIDFMEKMFKGEMYGGVIKAGEAEADAGNLESACIYFRAALLLKPDDLRGMYDYAMATREIYLATEDADEEYIGRFKAETIEVLEQLTIIYPDFADPYYYLGYAYLNLGLYIKADLTFKDYLVYATDFSKKQEVRERRSQLEGPVEIEDGINHVTRGLYAEGLEKLAKYINDPKAENWWPLHYYAGLAYLQLGLDGAAGGDGEVGGGAGWLGNDDVQRGIHELKRALVLNPSHIESMEALADAYEALGDTVNCEKYLKKIEIVKSYE